MDPYVSLVRQLLVALGSSTVILAGCGGRVGDDDTTPDTERGTRSDGSGGATAPATPPVASNPPSSEPPPVACEYGTPEKACYDREQLENMVRHGVGQIPEPPKSDEEVAAAFDASGCAHMKYVADGCCNPAETAAVKEGGLCCYVHCTGSCCGRPLLVDGRARIANAMNRADWLGAAADGPAEVAEHLREAVAKAWLDDALLEHASVASFSRFSLDLLSWGAPPELLAEAHRAALDEIEHARLCFSIVEHVSGETIGPSAIDLSDVRVAGHLADVAVSAVREGCVGETLAALIAREQLARARHPTVRAALERIADDEARHAELAWRFVAWACSTGDDSVRRAVRAAFEEELSTQRFGRTVRVWQPADLRAWHALGRLSDEELAEIEGRAKRECVAVLVGELLGTRGSSVTDGVPSRSSPGLA